MSQSWPLSETANKSKGTCSVCFATRQLHLRDGTVHQHGPRGHVCPGSNKPPLTHSTPIPSQVSRAITSTTSDAQSGPPQAPLHAATAQSNGSSVPSSSAFWSPSDLPLIKHIPKSVRGNCATHLASLLNKICNDPASLDNWADILRWGQAVLANPKRSGKRHAMSSIIRNRIAAFSSGETSEVLVTRPPPRKPLDTSLMLAQAVTAKLEDGNIKAAIRLLNSDDTPAAPSEITLNLLKAKHPSASKSLAGLPAPSQFHSISVSEAEVRQAILSFPAGSSGGPDGLRPQHLRDMLQCTVTGSEFLTSACAFTNLILSGGCPAAVAPIFFGGKLLALNKKGGGIRPIAVGFTFRRLVSKCANKFGTEKLKNYFHPHQLGVGTAGGCEAAVHAARRFLHDMPSDHIMVKLDFNNAFNSLHRSDLLEGIANRLPELFPFVYSAYSHHSTLYFGPYQVSSEVGVQQGDPIGSLCFSNAIHPVLSSLRSTLNLGYLDDVTLGGPQAVVAADVQSIVSECGRLGLTLNVSKCELICHDDLIITDSRIRSFARVKVDEASLLGAPLHTGTALDAAWSFRCNELKRAVERLKLISAQGALILLRSSFSSPKVLHLLRCSLSASHPALKTFDDILKKGIEQITNTVLSDTQWMQASLPIKDGGLGVRRVTSLATSAFIASAASTCSLQDDLLSSCPFITPYSWLQSYLDAWSSRFGAPPSPLPLSQSFWDRSAILLDRSEIEANFDSSFHKAAYLAANSIHSGAWLHAMPIASCGLQLDDDAVRVAVGLRLGLNQCIPHKCNCGAQVDARGVHGFVCRHAPGKTSRHHALNDVIARAFASAGLPVTKEPNGLSRTDGKRPDGMTLIPWQCGKAVLWDVTVICTSADSYLDSSARETGAAAEIAATRKTVKYANLSDRYIFIPVAVETQGPLNTSATELLVDLGRRISSTSGDPRETSFLFQRISVVIQRFNSVLMKDSFLFENQPE